MTAEGSSAARVNEFAKEVRALDRALRSPAFAPTTEQDWVARASDVRALSSGGLSNLAELRPLLEGLDAATCRQAKDRVQLVLTEIATLETLCGQQDYAAVLLQAAASVASVPEVRELLEAHAESPAVQAELAVCRRLTRERRDAEADRRLKALRKQSLSPPLRAELEGLLSRPRPIGGASELPVLATYGAIGFRLYGARDVEVDGSYIATQCFCVLLVPVIPLRAYRVSKNDNGSLTFHATVPLSNRAKSLRAAVLAALLALLLLTCATK